MRTHIVATIGPKSESKEVLHTFVAAGMNIARMNFSHCTFDEYRMRRNRILEVAAEQKKTVKILQDLQGPRIRVGELPKAGVFMEQGKTFLFSTDAECPAGVIHVDDPHLHLDIKVGDPMYLVNGEIELLVRAKNGTRIEAEVIRGGTLFSRKAVNVPHTKLTATGPTKKDLEDVAFALAEGVDFIAVSFVQTAADIKRLRAVVGTKAKIIAKIETSLSLQNIDEIIRAADGIMIARGDLGIEIPIEQVPFVQKNLIRQAAWHGKPSITATQMLYSMIGSLRPTRAEVSDIANAVWDGTDAVMLSDETASGAFPLESLQTMARIVAEAERSLYERKSLL